MKVKPYLKMNSIGAGNCQKKGRKVLNIDNGFQKVMTKFLKAQLANGLRDSNHAIYARAIIKQDPEISFTDFRSTLTTILECGAHTIGSKGVSSNAHAHVHTG